MKEVSFESKVWGSDDRFESAEGSGPSLQDAAEFRQLLRGDPQVPEADSPSVGGILNRLTAGLRESEQKFDKGLKRVSQTGDPVEIVKLQKNLSDLYINHSLAVKVLSKTTQAVDNLMRLQ